MCLLRLISETVLLRNHLLLETTCTAVTRALFLDVRIFARFKVDCEVMPLRSFANFKLVMSRHMKELRRTHKTRGPRPWPIRPMRKSVTG